MSTTADPIIDVRNLVIEFTTERGVVRAVDDVSFSLQAGETLGVVRRVRLWQNHYLPVAARACSGASWPRRQRRDSGEWA